MTFHKLELKYLFPTPLIIAAFSSEHRQKIVDQLLPIIFDKSRTDESKNLTNIGGWQSDTRLLDWGGEAVDLIVKNLSELIDSYTMNLLNPNFELGIHWKIYGWANINRKGNLNTVHTHPGSQWSAIYYVKIDEPDGEDVGGELEIIDPRGTLPITYAPNLRFRKKELFSCGGHELHKPKAGDCLLFPSWLSHGVMPYKGEGTRISLAFNFSV